MPKPVWWPRADMFDDHRRWRPEWTEQRSCLYWYLTFEDQPAVAALAARASGGLGDLAAVDLVPPRWLHLTVCDIGFVDEVDRERLPPLVEAVAGELRSQPPLRLTLGPVAPCGDAVALMAGPTRELERLWKRVAAGMRAVGTTPPHHLEEAFRPHVTLGYLNRPASVDTVLDALGEPSVRGTVEVDRLTLAAVSRRQGHYQWDCGAVVSFGDRVVASSTSAALRPSLAGRRRS